MSYYTIQAIIISLLVIIGIHYLITKVLFNEKKYKNKMKKKVVFQLPQDEEKTPEIDNVDTSQESTDSNGDLSSMKNDIMEFMDTNEIYQKDSPTENVEDSDPKKDFSPSDFGNQQTNLEQFFKNNNLDKTSEPELLKKETSSSEPKIDLSTKKRIDINPDKIEQDNLMKPDLWKYENESIMNGGSLGGGLAAFDGCDSSLAVY